MSNVNNIDVKTAAQNLWDAQEDLDECRTRFEALSPEAQRLPRFREVLGHHVGVYVAAASTLHLAGFQAGLHPW